jgi:cytochrome P450
MAGHETTANSLAWTWFLLSQAPEVEERLHGELAEVLDGRLPGLDDVPRLVYTRAVFEEAIRLYPPVPLLGRQALHEERIRNRTIPAGSLVIVIPWLLHRHRALWDQPDHFVPERFLPENAAARDATATSRSASDRGSASQAFSLAEAILYLAALARARAARPGAVVRMICS